jgi:UDP-2,3-diacylglucosamine pyrophosphatase LpxH
MVLSADGVSAGTKFDFSIVSLNPRLQHDTRFLLIEFNKEIDGESLGNAIELSDSSGSLNGNYTLELYPLDARGFMVWFKFNDGFSLDESTKYTVTAKKGLRYVNKTTSKGVKRYRLLRKKISHDFVTRSQCPLVKNEKSKNIKGEDARTKIVVISDIHIGDKRATDQKYNWFSDNNTALQSFLDDVLASEQVKELVIIGDFFDEWVIPAGTKPFEGTVTTSDEFFQSIADADTIKPIIKKFNDIADSGTVKLIYVPGNHDMLFSEAALKLIIPNAIWYGRSDSDGKPLGSGSYSPETGIIMEHGHIYDFYNAPDPYSQSGSILPPGFFVSRWYATKMITKGKEKEQKEFLDNEKFYVSWEGMLLLGGLFSEVEAITGIDGYTDNYSQDQARDHYYYANIGDNWKERQEHNNVYSYESVWRAIMVGTADFNDGLLITAAENQYFKTNRANIVLFGHTHKDVLKTYDSNNESVSNSASDVAKIYANTGTWVNQSQVSSPYKTRTYVVINTATLDTVSVYQYNLVDNKGESTLLYEANISE